MNRARFLKSNIFQAIVFLLLVVCVWNLVGAERTLYHTVMSPDIAQSVSNGLTMNAISIFIASIREIISYGKLRSQLLNQFQFLEKLILFIILAKVQTAQSLQTASQDLRIKLIRILEKQRVQAFKNSVFFALAPRNKSPRKSI